MTLARLQHALADHIHDRPSVIAAALADTRGLAVYHNAYRATLRSTLRDTYARTAKWLGDETFDAVANAYVAGNPSVSWTLDAYGAGFPKHLGRVRPADPEAAELAWLEGALRKAFSAADTPPLNRGSLTSVDWETATIDFAPGVAVHTIAYDVPGIWHALEFDSPPERVALDRPLGLVVWRDGLDPRFRSADPLEADSIASLLVGTSFSSTCAAAAKAGADPQAVGSWLASWIDDGMIARING